MTITMAALEQETAYYRAHRDQWVRDGHEGQWVVLRGESVLGFYDSLKAAYMAALAKYGQGVSFFVKEIRPSEEDVETLQRVQRRPISAHAVKETVPKE